MLGRVGLQWYVKDERFRRELVLTHVCLFAVSQPTARCELIGLAVLRDVSAVNSVRCCNVNVVREHCLLYLTRAGHVTCAIGSRLYVTGGYRAYNSYGYTTNLNALEIFDVATNTWSSGPSMVRVEANCTGHFGDCY